jgi:hypothetical protein
MRTKKEPKMIPKPTLCVRRGLYAACHVAMASYDAADGRGDVSHEDAKRIEEAMIWLESF